MSGLTTPGGALGVSVLGEKFVASAHASSGAVGAIVQGARAALPFTGFALLAYLALAAALLITGVVLQQLGRSRSRS